jgi:hypothetical protein
MSDARNLATDKLTQEAERLALRQKQVQIMQDLINGLTEEQLEAMMALSDVCQNAARQRMSQMQAGNMAPPRTVAM